jgi:hypothetical protein
MSYYKNHEWSEGTLVLDPGVFTFDEPHVYMGQDPPAYARSTSCMYRNDLQQRCRAPAKLLAVSHLDAPDIVKEKCDSQPFGEGYCCPPFAAPRNWRVDFLPLGQEEDAMLPDDSLLVDAEIYAADARLVAGKLQMEAQPVLEEFTSDAQEVYDEISKAVYTEGSVAVQQVTPVVTETADDMRSRIRKHPLLALGVGIAAGAFVAKVVSRRR